MIQNASYIIGRVGGLATVMKQVDTVAHLDVPVLLVGETGSGKEVIARAIHLQSKRAAQPFIRVNCGSIAPELIDSELFGHEKGSFTGAVDAHMGWFERANGGTLLLDEIGEMKPDVQVRLLRVLQEGEFYRVGGKKLVHVDVRILAATHRDLKNLVAAGRFREDLMYRISTFPIFIPPLRDRRSDIVELAHYFVQRASQKFGVACPPVTPSDIDRLVSYSWPGNVREFISVIERAVILGEGLELKTAASLGIYNQTPSSDAAVFLNSQKSLSLDDVIQHHIKSVLIETGGRIDGKFGAANRLKLNPNTLRSKMRKYQIHAKEFKS